jgi:hypothetical protein
MRYGSAGLIVFARGSASHFTMLASEAALRRERSLIVGSAAGGAWYFRASDGQPAWRRPVGPRSAASSSRAHGPAAPAAPRRPPGAPAARPPRGVRRQDPRSPSGPRPRSARPSLRQVSLTQRRRQLGLTSAQSRPCEREASGRGPGDNQDRAKLAHTECPRGMWGRSSSRKRLTRQGTPEGYARVPSVQERA